MPFDQCSLQLPNDGAPSASAALTSSLTFGVQRSARNFMDMVHFQALPLCLFQLNSDLPEIQLNRRS